MQRGRGLCAFIKSLPFKVLHTKHILESIEQGLVHHHRSQGCLLPCSDLPRPLEVPSVRLSGAGIRIQSPSVRPVPVSKSLYQGRGVRFGTTPKKRHKDSALPRRLVDLRPLSPAGHARHEVLAHIQSLGFRANLKKSDQNPRIPLGLDALSHEWPEGLLYGFPPLPLIPHVLNRVAQGRYKVLFVAPRWPARHWFPILPRLVHGQPWPLPVRADLLSQAKGQIWHPRQLWAWLLLSPCLKS